MGRWLFWVVVVTGVAIGSAPGFCQSIGNGDAAPADMVIVGGLVRTMRPDGAVAEAVGVRDGRIVHVGSRAGAEALVGAATRVIDATGRTVLPGLIDSHAHLVSLGRLMAQVNLIGTVSIADVRDRVRARAREVARGAWIQGRGWDQNDWEEVRFPTWRDLAGTEDNPVCLRRVDGHAAWLNRSALRQLGIDANSPDPPGGRILRDENGDPTGVLIDTADEQARARIPAPSEEEQVERLRRALSECVRFGLTGVHEAGVDETTFRALRQLLEGEALSLRVYCMISANEERYAQSWLARGPWQDPSGRLTVRALKIYGDGALGSRGAALLAPYADEPGNTGLMRLPQRVYARWAGACVDAGFQLCAHAIGDAANRLILDVYENATAGRPAMDHRFRIEHAQVVAKADLARFASLGVIAAMQPTHATSDMYWARERLGEARLDGAYAWRTLLDSGAVVVCGSDFPVESVNPLWGMYAAITRQDHSGWPAGGWHPQQRMRRDEAVAGFTRLAAYAEFAENLKGTIEVSKYADFTIVDRDPLSCDPSDLLSAQVAFTIVGGNVVYEAAMATGSSKE